MSQLYLLQADGNGELISFDLGCMTGRRAFDDEVRFMTLLSRQGSVIDDWEPVYARGSLDAGHKPLDFAATLFPGVLIASDRARVELAPSLGDQAEFLPINHDAGREYFILRAKNIVDAIDYDSAVLDYRKRSDKLPENVRAIKTYAFKMRELDGCSIFRVPEAVKGFPIVSRSVKVAAEVATLTGAQFIPLIPDAVSV